MGRIFRGSANVCASGPAVLVTPHGLGCVCPLSRHTLLHCPDPHEKETLLPPLLGLAVSGTSVDGDTLVVKSRLSLNMASLTLEQVAGKRKKLLSDMSAQMQAELNHAQMCQSRLGSRFDAQMAPCE